MQQRLVKVQSARKAPPSSLADKILMIVPGLDGYNTIMQDVRNELAQNLPTIGIKLDERQPFTTTKLYLDPAVIQILNRERIVGQISDIGFDELSPIEKIQTLSAIEGIAIPPIHNLSSAKEDLANNKYHVGHDIRHGKEVSEAQMLLRPDQSQKSVHEAESESPATNSSGNEHPQLDTDDHELTTDDLAVLKKIA